ncbi:MAG: TSUP family transporter [Faecalibacterium sp.]
MEGITLSIPMLIFLMCMTGFAGLVDSAAGGGGLISLPAYLFAGLPVHYTYGTNKFSAACGTTFATLRFFKSGAMDLKVGLLAAAGSFAGSGLGSRLVLLLSEQALRTMMLVILPVAAVLILWRRKLPDENRDDGVMSGRKALLAVAIGLGIGLYDGLFGPGTGTFAIIAFTTLMGFDLRTASGNAKVLNLASNYASLVTYLSSELVVFSIGIPCALSGIAGNLIGSRLALTRGARFIRPMMLVVLVLLLGKLVSDALL